MANYTQQCRKCNRGIEGSGDNICFACLERELAKAESIMREIYAKQLPDWRVIKLLGDYFREKEKDSQ